MALNYPGDWKFDGIGFGIPDQAISDFHDLIINIASGSKAIIEQFKHAFGGVGLSSSYDWATSDMRRQLEEKASNAAVFVDCLWGAIDAARSQNLKVPSHDFVNKIIAKHGIPLKITPPDLLHTQDSVIVDAATADDGKADEGPIPVYVLGDEIGTGGYGVVYKAKKSTTISEFEYALKILDPSPFVEDYDKALKRFRREIIALQSLQHRAIIQIFEAGLTVENKPYVVMPLVEGVDLRSATAEMRLIEIIRIFIEILLALEYAHKLDVIHRDLKPSNIIVRSSDLQPIILDFGSAFVLDQLNSQSLTSQAVGTIGYIPSEVITDPKKRSSLHDVYSCGVMLYESLARRLPDPANYVPLAEKDHAYRFLDSIVEQAIAGERTRTGSAEEFANQLSVIEKEINDFKK